MRFSVFTTLLSLTGFIAGGLAAPAADAASLARSEERRATGTSPVAQMASAIGTLNAEISAASAALKQNLTNISPSSPPDVLAGGQAAAIATFNSLGAALQAASQNLTSQSAQKRQSSGATGPDPSTGDLVNAIQALVSEVIGLIDLALNALGLGQFSGEVTGVLTVFGGLVNSIANVVVDVLPFLPDIASLVGAVGTLLSGIGSLIPKAA